MVTDEERREVARRLRELMMTAPGVTSVGHGHLWSLLWAVSGDELGGSSRRDWFERMCSRLADLIEPSCDLVPSGWTSFDERLPERGAPVLCKGKNGAYYVGKPVTFDGERTDKVWVPRGAEYRSPAAWRPVDSPPCDRDALLALAEELDGLGLSGFSSGWSSGAVNVGSFARRIREALEVDA